MAYQHIGVSPGIELDKVRKRYLAPAAEELESAGYLEPAPEEERFTKLRRGLWTASFTYRVRKESIAIPEQTVDRTGKRLQALARRGVSTLLAVQLVDSVSDDKLVRAVRAMDEQRRRGVNIRSADKWLTTALHNGFQPSPEYIASQLRPDRKIFRKKRSD